MQLETLKIFCDVVRHHSFSVGAAVNHVSQSAASQAVHQLEKRLGTQLIDRSKRPWLLTSEGRFFFEGSQDIIERFAELESTLKRQVAASYKVRVAAIYSVGMHNMTTYVDAIRRVAPGVSVEIEYMHPDQVCQRVHNDEADLGLISFASPARDLQVIPWREEEMVIACLPEHPLAAHDSVSPAAISGEQFIRFERGLPIRREMTAFLRHHGVAVDVVADFDNVATVKQAVEDGVGIAILPRPVLRRDVERGALAAVRFEEAVFLRPLSIIHRKRRRLNGAVKDFIQLLCDQGSLDGARFAGSDKSTGNV